MTERDIPNEPLDDAELSDAELAALARFDEDEPAAPVVTDDEDDDDGYYRPDGYDEDEELEDEDDTAASPRVRARLDTVSRVLLWAAVVLIIIVLTTTGAIFYYLNLLNKAPRTMAERDVATWETAVVERPGDANAWASLAYAYADAKRFDDALEAARKGTKAANEPTMVLVEADVLRAAGRYREAVETYDKAEKAIAAKEKAIATERKKKGVEIPAEKSDALMRVFLGRGIAQAELGDTDAAIADLEKAAAQGPEQVAISVKLGDLYLAKGQTDKAEKAYRSALRFVPDDASALAGLKKISEGKQ